MRRLIAPIAPWQFNYFLLSLRSTTTKTEDAAHANGDDGESVHRYLTIYYDGVITLKENAGVYYCYTP